MVEWARRIVERQGVRVAALGGHIASLVNIVGFVIDPHPTLEDLKVQSRLGFDAQVWAAQRTVCHLEIGTPNADGRDRRFISHSAVVALAYRPGDRPKTPFEQIEHTAAIGRAFCIA